MPLPRSRDEKRRQEKEAIAATFINLTKEAIEVQRMNGQVACRGESDMSADLSIMDPD
jgi:hypothetical protein